MSTRKTPKEEVVTVFVRQDSQGNMHFSDTPETSLHETQTYDVHTKSTGRIAFPEYWVWGTMLSVWVLFYTALALILWALRYPFQQRELTPPASNPKSTKAKTSDNEPLFRQPLSPYQVLGIQENASAEQIKAAYRKQMANYHPDRVAHLGLELQDVARKKATEINRAYETLLSK